MSKTSNSFKTLLLGLYFKPQILIISMYQIIVSSTFTAQQILLAAYLNELGYFSAYSVLSGIILAVYFVFSFLFGPLCGALSDNHGRKKLMIGSNWISGLSLIGLALISNPFMMLILNSLLGLGASLRTGSSIALWIQHSPQERVGESIGYSNIMLGIGGGVGLVFIGLFNIASLFQLSFIFFGLMLILSAIPIIFLSDLGNYQPFSLTSVVNSLQTAFKGKLRNNFFFTKPILQVSLHWVAFSVIISFGTFLIPILDLVVGQLPTGLNLSISLLILILIGLIVSLVGGLLVWGRLSDHWRIKPVLILGFIGTCLLALMVYVLFEFDLIVPVITGLTKYDLPSILTIILFLMCLFTAIGLIPTPMAWITELVGEDDLAKAMSLRMALIAVGTIIGTAIGPFILVNFGIGGLMLVVLIFLIISGVIVV
ncbi:MAG: MFS transporter [Candidatus Hodarchaeales archaeon]